MQQAILPIVFHCSDVDYASKNYAQKQNNRFVKNCVDIYFLFQNILKDTKKKERGTVDFLTLPCQVARS